MIPKTHHKYGRFLRSKLPVLRTLALATCVFFLASDILSFPSMALAGTRSAIVQAPGGGPNVNSLASATAEPGSSFGGIVQEIAVPPGLGTISDVYPGIGDSSFGTGGTKNEERVPGPGSRFVVLMQNAHSIPDSQRSLRGLIDHLVKNYCVKTVALEGAAGKLDPTLFRLFPDAEKREKVFADYLDTGELSGAAAASVFLNDETEFVGIEDWKLYQEGAAAFLDGLAKQADFKSQISNLKTALQDLKLKYYSKEALKFDQKLRAWQENPGRLAELLQCFAEIRTWDPGLEKTHPGVAAVIQALRKENVTEGSALENEIKALAIRTERLVKDSSARMKLNKLKQASRTGAIGRAELAYELWGLVPFLSEKESVPGEKVPVPLSPELRDLISGREKLAGLKGPAFMRELDTFIAEMRARFAATPEARAIAELDERLGLTDKLVSFELSREEWIKIRDSSPGTRNPFITIKDEIENLKRQAGEFQQFYELAERREAVFLDNLNKLLLKNRSRGARGESRITNAVVLVAGGFHTSGLAAKLKEQGIPYVVISPAIRDVPDDNRYVDHMQGKVSWAKYFRPRDGRIDLYDAFARATSERLLADRAERGADSSRFYTRHSALHAREWRDTVIRTLAREGRAADHSKYTRYIDSAGVEMSEEFRTLRETWTARLEKFINGLKSLHANGKLTEVNAAKLLSRPANETPYAVNMVPGMSVPVSFARDPAKRETETNPATAVSLAPDILAPAQPNASVRSEARDEEKDKPSRKKPAVEVSVKGKNKRGLSENALYETLKVQLPGLSAAVISELQKTEDIGRWREILLQSGLEVVRLLRGKFLHPIVKEFLDRRESAPSARVDNRLRRGNHGRYLAVYLNDDFDYIIKTYYDFGKKRTVQIDWQDAFIYLASLRLKDIAVPTLIIDSTEKDKKEFVYKMQDGSFRKTDVAVIQQKVTPLYEYLENLDRKGDFESQKRVLDEFKRLVIQMFRRGVVDADFGGMLANYGVDEKSGKVYLFDFGDLSGGFEEAFSFESTPDLTNEYIEKWLRSNIGDEIADYFLEHGFKESDFRDAATGRSIFLADLPHGERPEFAMEFPYTEEEIREMFLNRDVHEILPARSEARSPEGQMDRSRWFENAFILYDSSDEAFRDFLDTVLSGAAGILTRKQGDVFRAWYKGELNLTDIAAGSGISRPAAEMLLGRALRNIRKALIDQGFVRFNQRSILKALLQRPGQKSGTSFRSEARDSRRTERSLDVAPGRAEAREIGDDGDEQDAIRLQTVRTIAEEFRQGALPLLEHFWTTTLKLREKYIKGADYSDVIGDWNLAGEAFDKYFGRFVVNDLLKKHGIWLPDIHSVDPAVRARVEAGFYLSNTLTHTIRYGLLSYGKRPGLANINYVYDSIPLTIRRLEVLSHQPVFEPEYLYDPLFTELKLFDDHPPPELPLWEYRRDLAYLERFIGRRLLRELQEFGNVAQRDERALLMAALLSKVHGFNKNTTRVIRIIEKKASESGDPMGAKREADEKISRMRRNLELYENLRPLIKPLWGPQSPGPADVHRLVSRLRQALDDSLELLEILRENRLMGRSMLYGICVAEKKRYAAWHAEDKERRARMISDTDLPFGDQMPAVAVARKKYSESSFLQARSEVRQDDAREASARRVEVKEEPVAAVYGPVRVERGGRLGMPGALLKKYSETSLVATPRLSRSGVIGVRTERKFIEGVESVAPDLGSRKNETGRYPLSDATASEVYRFLGGVSGYVEVRPDGYLSPEGPTLKNILENMVKVWKVWPSAPDAFYFVDRGDFFELWPAELWEKKSRGVAEQWGMDDSGRLYRSEQRKGIGSEELPFYPDLRDEVLALVGKKGFLPSELDPEDFFLRPFKDWLRDPRTYAAPVIVFADHLDVDAFVSTLSMSYLLHRMLAVTGRERIPVIPVLQGRRDDVDPVITAILDLVFGVTAPLILQNLPFTGETGPIDKLEGDPKFVQVDSSGYPTWLTVDHHPTAPGTDPGPGSRLERGASAAFFASQEYEKTGLPLHYKIAWLTLYSVLSDTLNFTANMTGQNVYSGIIKIILPVIERISGGTSGMSGRLHEIFGKFKNVAYDISFATPSDMLRDTKTSYLEGEALVSQRFFVNKGRFFDLLPGILREMNERLPGMGKRMWIFIGTDVEEKKSYVVPVFLRGSVDEQIVHLILNHRSQREEIGREGTRIHVREEMLRKDLMAAIGPLLRAVLKSEALPLEEDALRIEQNDFLSSEAIVKYAKMNCNDYAWAKNIYDRYASAPENPARRRLFFDALSTLLLEPDSRLRLGAAWISSKPGLIGPIDIPMNTGWQDRSLLTLLHHVRSVEEDEFFRQWDVWYGGFLNQGTEEGIELLHAQLLGLLGNGAEHETQARLRAERLIRSHIKAGSQTASSRSEVRKGSTARTATSGDWFVPGRMRAAVRKFIVTAWRRFRSALADSHDRPKIDPAVRERVVRALRYAFPFDEDANLGKIIRLSPVWNSLDKAGRDTLVAMIGERNPARDPADKHSMQYHQKLYEWLSREPNEIFLLVDPSGLITGHVIVRMGPLRGNVYDLWTHPKGEKRGTFLMKCVLGWLREAGFKEAVWISGIDAMAFYHKLLAPLMDYSVSQKREFSAYLDTWGRLSAGRQNVQEAYLQSVRERETEVRKVLDRIGRESGDFIIRSTRDSFGEADLRIRREKKEETKWSLAGERGRYGHSDYFKPVRRDMTLRDRIAAELVFVEGTMLYEVARQERTSILSPSPIIPKKSVTGRSEVRQAESAAGSASRTGMSEPLGISQTPESRSLRIVDKSIVQLGLGIAVQKSFCGFKPGTDRPVTVLNIQALPHIAILRWDIYKREKGRIMERTRKFEGSGILGLSFREGYSFVAGTAEALNQEDWTKMIRVVVREIDPVAGAVKLEISGPAGDGRDPGADSLRKYIDDKTASGEHDPRLFGLTLREGEQSRSELREEDAPQEQIDFNHEFKKRFLEAGKRLSHWYQERFDRLLQKSPKFRMIVYLVFQLHLPWPHTAAYLLLATASGVAGPFFEAIKVAAVPASALLAEISPVFWIIPPIVLLWLGAFLRTVLFILPAWGLSKGFPSLFRRPLRISRLIPYNFIPFAGAYAATIAQLWFLMRERYQELPNVSFKTLLKVNDLVDGVLKPGSTGFLPEDRFDLSFLSPEITLLILEFQKKYERGQRLKIRITSIDEGKLFEKVSEKDKKPRIFFGSQDEYEVLRKRIRQIVEGNAREEALRETNKKWENKLRKDLKTEVLKEVSEWARGSGVRDKGKLWRQQFQNRMDRRVQEQREQRVSIIRDRMIYDLPFYRMEAKKYLSLRRVNGETSYRNLDRLPPESVIVPLFDVKRNAVTQTLYDEGLRDAYQRYFAVLDLGMQFGGTLEEPSVDRSEWTRIRDAEKAGAIKFRVAWETFMTHAADHNERLIMIDSFLSDPRPFVQMAGAEGLRKLLPEDEDLSRVIRLLKKKLGSLASKEVFRRTEEEFAGLTNPEVRPDFDRMGLSVLASMIVETVDNLQRVYPKVLRAFTFSPRAFGDLQSVRQLLRRHKAERTSGAAGDYRPGWVYAIHCAMTAVWRFFHPGAIRSARTETPSVAAGDRDVIPAKDGKSARSEMRHIVGQTRDNHPFDVLLTAGSVEYDPEKDPKRPWFVWKASMEVRSQSADWWTLFRQLLHIYENQFHRLSGHDGAHRILSWARMFLADDLLAIAGKRNREIRKKIDLLKQLLAAGESKAGNFSRNAWWFRSFPWLRSEPELQPLVGLAEKVNRLAHAKGLGPGAAIHQNRARLEQALDEIDRRFSVAEGLVGLLKTYHEEYYELRKGAPAMSHPAAREKAFEAALAARPGASDDLKILFFEFVYLSRTKDASAYEWIRHPGQMLLTLDGKDVAGETLRIMPPSILAIWPGYVASRSEVRTRIPEATARTGGGKAPGETRILSSGELTEAEAGKLARTLVEQGVAVSTGLAGDEIHAEELGREYIAKMARRAEGKDFLAAFINREPAGFISFEVSFNPDGRTKQAVIVDARSWVHREGVGSGLFRAVKAYLYSIGVTRLSLVVGDTPSGQKFWQKVIPERYLSRNRSGQVYAADLPLTRDEPAAGVKKDAGTAPAAPAVVTKDGRTGFPVPDSEVRSSDKLWVYIHQLLKKINDSAPESSGVLLSEVADDPGKYAESFFRPLIEIFLKRIAEDFRNTEPFTKYCRQILGEEGVPGLQRELRNGNPVLEEFLKGIESSDRTREASIEFYGLLLSFLTKNIECCFGRFYDLILPQKPDLALGRDRFSYHTRAESTLRLHDKGIAFGSDEAIESYKEGRDTLMDRKPGLNLEIRPQWRDKILRALELWKRKARESGDIAMHERITRFEASSVVIIFESDVSLVVTDADRNVGRVLHNEREINSFNFSSGFLDSLGLDNDEDMKELAVWLNAGQRWLDRYDSVRREAPGRDTNEMFHKVEAARININNRFFENEDSGLLDRDVLKRRFADRMKRQAIRRDADLMPSVIKSYETMERLLKEAETEQSPDRKALGYWKAFNQCRMLLLTLEAMGMHTDIRYVLQRMTDALTGLQLYEPDEGNLFGQQCVLVLSSLRLGRWEDFINELEILLGVRSVPSSEFGEIKKIKDIYDAEGRRRGLPVPVTEAFFHQLRRSRETRPGKMERIFKRAMHAQFLAAGPEHYARVRDHVEYVNQLFERFYDSPVIKAVNRKNGSEASAISRRSEARELEKQRPPAVLRDGKSVREKMADEIVTAVVNERVVRPEDLKWLVEVTAGDMDRAIGELRRSFEDRILPAAFAAMTAGTGDVAAGFRAFERVLRENSLTREEIERTADRMFETELKSLAEAITQKEIGGMAPIVFYSPEIRSRLVRFIGTVQEAFEAARDVTGKNYRITIVSGNKPELDKLKTELGKSGALRGVQFIDAKEMNKLASSVIRHPLFGDKFGVFFPDHTIDPAIAWQRVVRSEIPKEYAVLLLPALSRYFATVPTSGINATTLRHALPGLGASARVLAGRGIAVVAEFLNHIAQAARQIARAA